MIFLLKYIVSFLNKILKLILIKYISINDKCSMSVYSKWFCTVKPIKIKRCGWLTQPFSETLTSFYFSFLDNIKWELMYIISYVVLIFFYEVGCVIFCFFYKCDIFIIYVNIFLISSAMSNFSQSDLNLPVHSCRFFQVLLGAQFLGTHLRGERSNKNTFLSSLNFFWTYKNRLLIFLFITKIYARRRKLS